ncbi:SAV_2336 N-terminal domain-related protein [Streptomyces chartreusis]|uniref:SAV_2336 N-terminal domain-related protein n=1 Tax=Streptomyces chartreusis TaxID=1969 RepID=UPI003654E45F
MASEDESRAGRPRANDALPRSGPVDAAWQGDGTQDGAPANEAATGAPEPSAPRDAVPGGDTGSAVGLLATALAAAGMSRAGRPDEPPEPTPRELAELLWLAGWLGEADQNAVAAAAPDAVPGTGTTAATAPAVAPAVTPETARPAPRQEPEPVAPPDADRVPLRLPAQPPPPAPDDATSPQPEPEPPNVRGTPLLVPAPLMLPHPLTLQRALRPLKRTVPSTTTRVLDEGATADRIAGLGAHPDVWLPVLRPAPERWLRLNLVHDTGPTMPVWDPLVRELHALVAQTGIFRTVTLHPATPDGRVRHPPAHADGRTVTLLISDCMGPQWRPCAAGRRWYRVLRRWAARLPLAVVQPLPEHLWHTTALPATPGLLTSRTPAAATSTLSFTPYDPDAPPRPPSALPIPVLEPDPAWLAHWAALLADPGGSRIPGAVAWLRPAPPVPDDPSAPDLASLSPEDLVMRFRATASPEAFRLAGHLTLADPYPYLPVMRLVQRALEPHPRPQHLAEIILSGLLKAVPGPPGRYAFRTGVRDVLHRSLPRTARARTREFLARVGGLIEERAGLVAGEFHAEAGSGGGPGDDHGGEHGTLATVSEEAVRRITGEALEQGQDGRVLAGRYRLVRQLGEGGAVWEAWDEDQDERVAVRFVRREQPPSRDEFVSYAQALASVEHRNVVGVRDFGTGAGGEPYLVMDYLDGVPLDAVAEDGEGRVPFAESVVPQLARALGALQGPGLTHGRVSLADIVLLPDGTAVLTGFDARPASRRNDDLRLLGVLVRRSELELPEVYRADADALLFRAQELRRAPLERIANRRPSAMTRPTEPRAYVLLGPLRVTRGKVTITPSSHFARAMLGLLLQNRGRRVTFDDLAEGIWETRERPGPDEVRGVLHSLAAELRTSLRRRSIISLRGGYALVTYTDVVDLDRCLELMASAQHECEEGSLEAALDSTELALAMWHGKPLENVPGPAAEAARSALSDLRLSLLRTRENIAHARLMEVTETGIPEEHEQPPLPHLAVFQLPGPLDDDTLAEIERLVSGLVTASGLGSRDRRLEVTANGCLVRLPSCEAALQLLRTTVLQLADRTARFPGLRLVAVFGEATVQLAIHRSSIDDLLAVGDTHVLGVTELLHEAAAVTDTLSDNLLAPFPQGLPHSGFAPGAFRWYHLRTRQPAPTPPAGTSSPGRTGPFAVPPDVPSPSATRTVVYAHDKHPPTTTPPTQRERSDWRYYVVDGRRRQFDTKLLLRTGDPRHTLLCRARGSWRVTDPTVFVGEGPRDVLVEILHRVRREALAQSRRRSGSNSTAMERALNARMDRHKLPGVSIRCSVTVNPDPPLPHASDRTVGDLCGMLSAADTVLFCFDGPVARLYPTPETAREAARRLVGRAVEHPLEALRQFADASSYQRLNVALERIEHEAATVTQPSPVLTALLDALPAMGVRVAVVSDNASAVMAEFLRRHRLLDAVHGGVHGRPGDPTRLMPDTYGLYHAVGSLGASATDCVMVGSSQAEAAAAGAVGIPFVGLAPGGQERDRLRVAGARSAIADLSSLADAVRLLT